MSTPRSRRQQLEYQKHLKSQKDAPCQFCRIRKGHRQHLSESRTFRVIRNIFPYSIWDGQTVVDHLMVIPKKHVVGLAELNDKQIVELFKLIRPYEEQGYNVYARAPASIRKSVTHQHTHLIKTIGKPWDLIFQIRRPFFFRLPR